MAGLSGNKYLDNWPRPCAYLGEAEPDAVAA